VEYGTSESGTTTSVTVLAHFIGKNVFQFIKCLNLYFITQDLIQQALMFHLLQQKVLSNKMLLLTVTCYYIMLI